ncbi:MAG: quinone-dependent dihydroorotate dehydrogenase, partial [Anaerolineales bacterium]
PDELNEALDVILDSGMDGIIATNTTISRPPLISSHKTETGGLSGQPLKALSTRTVSHIFDYTKGKLPIIGVGGIASPQDALEKLNAGATLVQVYTGLIYRGPGLVKEIVEGIASKSSQPVV